MLDLGNSRIVVNAITRRITDQPGQCNRRANRFDGIKSVCNQQLVKFSRFIFDRDRRDAIINNVTRSTPFTSYFARDGNEIATAVSCL
ncbi:hypothetical protein AVEN_233988-1, partial [Araneus ventricosus]